MEKTSMKQLINFLMDNVLMQNDFMQLRDSSPKFHNWS